MITVAGEALIDIVVDPSGALSAHPGGAPFNVARMVARLGAQCRFLGRLSDDASGAQLRAALELEGVEIAISEPLAAPTTLATATLDDAGAADYRFYVDGTAAPQLRPADIRPELRTDTDALVLGALGIVVEPIASTLLALIDELAPEVPVLLDPNCRPLAIPDPAAYRRTVAALLARADVVKVSTDDLEFLYPGAAAVDSAR